jgi:hypothetical protein
MRAEIGSVRTRRTRRAAQAPGIEQATSDRATRHASEACSAAIAAFFFAFCSSSVLFHFSDCSKQMLVDEEN